MRTPAQISPPLISFAIPSFLSVGLGALIMTLAGLGPGTWGRNAAAWALGAVLAVGISVTAGRPRHSMIVLAAAIVGIAATFAAADETGVHRWIDIGALHINMAALVLPISIVAIARVGAWTNAALLFIAAAGALLVVQPDASQASAFLGAAAVLLLIQRASRGAKLAAAGLCVLAICAAWLRRDTLQPVAEVEQIFSLAADVSAPLAMLAAVTLAAACLSPLFSRSDDTVSRDAAWALATYMSLAALMPLFGAYPVPLVGLGMTFPVGLWLGVGALAARAEAPTRA